MELFPETASLYSLTALNELQVIFLHARAGEAGNFLIAHAPGSDRQYLDALTSDTPTFPYTAKQSEEFIDLLQCGKGVFRLLHPARPPANWILADQASNPYIITYVARLWATVGKLYASTSARDFS